MKWELTPTSRGQLGQAEDSVVAGNFLEGDVGVPAFIVSVDVYIQNWILTHHPSGSASRL